MSLSLSAQKQALRAFIREQKRMHSAEELKQFSDKICQTLEQLPIFEESKVILLYHALPDEVQTRTLLQKWYREKTLLLPVVQGDDLVLRKYTEQTTMTENLWKIAEPVGENYDTLQNIDLAIIPGMAFDTHGQRLGRGKGFYDRLLTQLKCPTIGLCYSFQKIENIPAESWDLPVEKVLCD